MSWRTRRTSGEAVAVLGCVLIGYFIGSLMGIPPYAVTLAGCAALFGWGLWRRQVGWGVVREISWPLFPFVAGLFVVVRGVENLGLAGLAARGLLGCNLGPNLSVAGSLASMLVFSSARRDGEDIGAREFFSAGLRITPLLLLSAGLALWLTWEMFP